MIDNAIFRHLDESKWVKVDVASLGHIILIPSQWKRRYQTIICYYSLTLWLF
jgi:hypothetical protein